MRSLSWMFKQPYPQTSQVCGCCTAVLHAPAGKLSLAYVVAGKSADLAVSAEAYAGKAHFIIADGLLRVPAEVVEVCLPPTLSA